MTMHFSADEIFEMAEKIEKNGAAFYKKAAGIFKDKQANKLFHDLASMEEEHRIIYATMRGELKSSELESTVFDPDDEVKLYLHAIADKNVFDKNPANILTGKESLFEVLTMSIGFEKDSIIFYLGLKDIMPERLGRAKINDIINEEKKHIVLLSEQLKAARK